MSEDEESFIPATFSYREKRVIDDNNNNSRDRESEQSSSYESEGAMDILQLGDVGRESKTATNKRYVSLLESSSGLWCIQNLNNKQLIYPLILYIKRIMSGNNELPKDTLKEEEDEESKVTNPYTKDDINSKEQSNKLSKKQQKKNKGKAKKESVTEAIVVDVAKEDTAKIEEDNKIE